jgi:serine/threonine-protein kinase RsbW
MASCAVFRTRRSIQGGGRNDNTPPFATACCVTPGGFPVQSPDVSDQVTIRIPANTAHVGLVRATGSALAALLDFTYDRITDLHIAIDEVCSRIMATSSPPPSHIEITFVIEDGSLEVIAKGDRPVKDGSEFLTSWSRAILESVTQGFEISQPDGATLISFQVAGG